MNQRDRIMAHLESGNTLTRLESWQALGILECPARISELRREGVPIRTEMVSVYNRFGEKISIAKWSL